MKHKNQLLLQTTVLLLIAAVLPACSVLTQPTLPGQLLFQDDFSRPSGWTRTTSPDVTMDYINNSFTFQLHQSNLEAWSTPGIRLFDTRTGVYAENTGGTRGSMFGLLCRYHDPDNYYFFLITDDGFAAVGSMVEGERILLNHPTMLPYDVILTGNNINHLQAECISNTLRFSVNGSLIAEVQDSRFTDGDVGLIAVSSDEPGGEIRYTSFTVHSP